MLSSRGNRRQRHVDVGAQLVAGYNDEKNAVTIEKTFAALLRLVEMLDDEQRRAVREGLDEDTLALFDLLVKPDLGKGDIKQLKAVAVGLYGTLMAQVSSMQDFATKQATRDHMRLAIRNYLSIGVQTGPPIGVE